MVFSSFAFIFFYLPLAIIGFWVCARLDHRLAALWLVLASLAFYGYWRVSFLPLLLGSIAFNYSVSRLIDRTENRPLVARGLLLFGVTANLLLLFYYKYAAALAASLGLTNSGPLALHDIVLPLGISFFTFTQIGYLVDVRQGVSKARDPLSYMLFVTFFPHLIAGPILHNREMMPQFSDPTTYQFSGRNFVVGMTIFVMGLAKKVLLADPLSSDVAANFAQAETAGLSTAWHGVVGYSLQLYFDFSGYSDMAIGLARLFNIRFPQNFNSPYKAATVIDYWQRFHMTLTRFITMYIFSPLALAIARWRAARGYDSSRRATTRPDGFAALVAFPTLVTMGLAGIWHGAGTQYLIFGLLHGFYIVVNHATRAFFPGPKNSSPRPRALRATIHASKVIAVYIAALVAFAFFRSNSTHAAFGMLSGMIGLNGLGPALPRSAVIGILILFAIVWACPNVQQIMSQYEPALGRPMLNPYPNLTWRPNTLWAIICGIIAAFSVLALGGTTEFLYFQF